MAKMAKMADTAKAANAAQAADTALANSKSAASGHAMRFSEVPLDILYDHPANDYSMDEDALGELLDSIRREGLAQPPIVRPYEDGYQIIAGHRRVECFRRLAQEDAQAYATIPVNILDECDDDRALVLVDVTNLMVRQLSVAERSKRYERLWNTVPELRRKRPELKGVRTSQVIAELITEETGQSVSRATIDRALAAGRRAQEVTELVEQRRSELIEPWIAEITGTEGFTPAVVAELASREAGTQEQLLADFRREGMSPRQFERYLSHESPKGDSDVEHALDSIIKTLRDVSSWKKKYGAAIDAYRVDYIRGQLDRLMRAPKGK